MAHSTKIFIPMVWDLNESIRGEQSMENFIKFKIEEALGHTDIIDTIALKTRRTHTSTDGHYGFNPHAETTTTPKSTAIITFKTTAISNDSVQSLFTAVEQKREIKIWYSMRRFWKLVSYRQPKQFTPRIEFGDVQMTNANAGAAAEEEE